MNKLRNGAWVMAGLLAVVCLGVFITPAMSHHSFAMYDQTKTLTFTGVLTRYVPQANHAELHFVPLGANGRPMMAADGKPVSWGVEMAGAAGLANQGITGTTFPAGTIFSVKLNPLRDGSNYGSREGVIVKCPPSKPPAAGAHCNSVEGSTTHGNGEF